MSDISPILSLPYIQPAQAQKHVTHNEALRLLDILVQLVARDRDQTVPPAVPAPGDCHIVGGGATGPWAGQDDAIALYENGAWQFLDPKPGWRAHVLAENRSVTFAAGDGWQDRSDETFAALEVGINATADATNRLVVASPATLLTHEGAGHQLKINKAAATDTASLLFQTGFSGRAEMGLAGSDGFAIKVSADGTGFSEALSVDPATGRVQMPQGLTVTGTLTGTAAARLGGLYATPGGTANAITLTYGLTALTSGMQVRFVAAAANTGATTINLDGLGAVACRTSGTPGAALPAGYIRTNVETTARYDGTFWVLDRQTERGSNANGDFVKFADGTQICTSLAFIGDSTTATGALFRWSATQTWTFPAAFSVTPNVGPAQSNNAQICWPAVGGTGKTTATVGLLSTVSVAARAAYYTANGFWY